MIQPPPSPSTSLASSPIILAFVLSAPATLEPHGVTLLFLRHSRHIPTRELLHLPFCLPGRLYPSPKVHKACSFPSFVSLPIYHLSSDALPDHSIKQQHSSPPPPRPRMSHFLLIFAYSTYCHLGYYMFTYFFFKKLFLFIITPLNI